MECPRCFFVKGQTVEGRRCAACGRSYQPSVNVYLGLVTLVYVVFIRYVNFALTSEFIDMRAPRCWPPLGLFGWARWPVDIQMRPELILVLGAMLAVIVFVPVVMSILYGKRAGFLLAAAALIVGPDIALGLLLMLSAWIAGGWTLRMNNKIGTALLASLPIWIAYLVGSRPTEDVPLPAAYYVPALVGILIEVALVFAVLLPMRPLKWNARWAGVALCLLCVVPIVAYKLAVGEDAIAYAVLSRDVGLQSALFRDVPGAEVSEDLWDEARKHFEQRRKQEIAERGPNPLHVPGIPTEQVDEQARRQAWVNLRKIELATELQKKLNTDREIVLDRCVTFLEKYPDSRYEPEVLHTMIRAMDMVVDTSALRGQSMASLPIDYDAGRIRSEHSREACQRLVEQYPESRWAIVARVKLADYQARRGNFQNAIGSFGDILQDYRDEVDAPLRDTANLSVFASLLDVGARRREAMRAEIVDREYRRAERERAFLLENAGDEVCGDQVLESYLRIGQFEVRSARVARLTGLLEACPNGKMSDNLAFDLATLETNVRDRMAALERVAHAYRGSDGAAMALYELAEIERRLEGDLLENKRKAVAHYRELIETYPDSYLAPMAERGLRVIERLLSEAGLSTGRGRR